MLLPSYSDMLFCFSTDDSFIRPVTFWIVGDFDSPSGRQLLYDAIKHQVSVYSFTPLSLFEPAIVHEHLVLTLLFWCGGTSPAVLVPEGRVLFFRGVQLVCKQRRLQYSAFI